MRASRLLSLLVMLVLAHALDRGGALAQTAETAAVITEIKPGRGRVEVKPAGGNDWRPARPLLALRAGDSVRTTENAIAVVLLSGGRGTTRVEGVGGSFTVPGAAAAGQAQKAKTLMEASLGYLAGTTKESSQAALATRSTARPPVILSPRNGRVLPESLTFEWLGSRLTRYTVRVVGPAGPVVERREVTGARWEYPADAPALSPGVRYSLQVTGPGQPSQEAWFEVVDAARARAVAADLASLDQEMGPGVSATSRAVLRAGLLAREDLLHDARQVVIVALAQDRDEPTLHLLLGDLYTRTGLTALAAESFDEAQFLLKK
ncbi:MAG TPA: hypothetical protein VL086_00135 [Candidatus Nitrosotalea sp.]|nr:hypothetical protein [Candidatus Nitrosotalea sp.]